MSLHSLPPPLGGLAPKKRFWLRVASRLALLLLGAVAARAQVTYYWNPDGDWNVSGGTGTWNLTDNVVNRPFLFWYFPTTWANDATTGNRLVLGGTAGTVTLADNTTIYANQLRFTTSGYVLQSGAGTSNLTLVGATPGIVTDAGVTATSSAVINGASLLLSGGGTFRLGASHRLSDTMAVTLQDGGTFDLNGYIDTVGAFTLANGSLTGAGALSAPGFTLVSGSVASNLSGAGAVTKTGAGIVTLNAASTYTGGTTIAGGTLQLGAANVLPDAGPVVVAGGTLALGANSDTVGAVTLRNDGTISGAGAATLTGTSYAVESGTVSARLAGAAGLTKSTAGTVTLSGANTYTGATAINGGTLRLTGSLGATPINLAAGATLTGNGSTTGSVTVAGLLSPGDGGIGTLTTGSEIWNGGGSLRFEINDATGTAGTNWDRLLVNGNVALNATAANPFTIRLVGLTSAGLAGTVANFNANNSYAWTFLSATSLTGFAANEFAVDLSEFTNFNTVNGTFSVALSGSGLSLLYTPIPEPRTYALLLGGATLAVVAWRRGKRGPVRPA